MAPDPDLYGPPERGNEDDEQDDDWEALMEWTTWTDEQANAALRIYDRKHGVYPYGKASDD
jgi:hypothetical protein